MPKRRARVVVQQRGRSRSRGAVRLQGASQTRRSREPGVTVLQAPKFDSKWQEYTLLRRGLEGEGFGLRRTMDMQDLDPDFCVYWGRKFRGRQVADGWVELGNGGYIPMDINGTRHVVAHLRGSVGGKGCGGLAQSSGGKGSSGMDAEPWPPARRPAAERRRQSRRKPSSSSSANGTLGTFGPACRTSCHVGGNSSQTDRSSAWWGSGEKPARLAFPGARGLQGLHLGPHAGEGVCKAARWAERGSLADLQSRLPEAG